MKNLSLQTFFFYLCTSANNFFLHHLPANNFFSIFFNHDLTQKGGSLLLPKKALKAALMMEIWF